MVTDSAGDNAAVESWHALLQERPGPPPLAHPRRAHEAIAFWTEHTYNRRRRQRSLGKLTPVEFELAFTAQAAAVAA